jgi:hypothetical protein
MCWVEALSNPQGLRRCLRDLVALSTSPATRNGDDPRQIAETAQVSLDADIVYVVLLHGADEGLNFARPRNGGADGG